MWNGKILRYILPASRPNHSIHFQMASNPNAELFVSSSGLWISVAGMYVYCYFATKVTTKIRGIGDRMYEIEWNCCPKDFCRFVQLTICRSQQPIFFHGYGLINCDMITLSKVQTWSFYFCLLSAIPESIYIFSF